MLKTKLLKLLQTFDASELRAFHDYVQSPFFNKQTELVELYQYIKGLARRNFPASRLTKMVVFERLFPNTPYDEKRLNHLISQLFKLAESFIGYRQMEQAGVVSDYYTLLAYVERKQEKPYRYRFDQARNQLNNQQLRNADYYFQQFLLADVAEKHFSQQNIRQNDESLQVAADYLDHYFLAQKLKFVCAMIDREMQLTTTYKANMLKEIELYLTKNTFEDIPAIHIYYTTYRTLTDQEDTRHFFQLRDLLKQYQPHFNRRELKDLYYFAINYCARKIRSGEQVFAEALMALYISGIEEEILIDEGQISPWTFKNMVKLGLGLRRFEWVESFVPQYHELLPHKEREAAYHYCMADLFYQKQDYAKAHFHLNQVEFTDIYYNLGAKVMLLKIYHENKETEALLSLIKAFKIFLKRNKLVSKNVKQTYLNFIALLGELQKCKPEQAEALRQKIRQTSTLTARSWLLREVIRG